MRQTCQVPDRESLLDLKAQLAAFGEGYLAFDQVTEALDELRQRFAGEIRILPVFVLPYFLPSASLAWLGHSRKLAPIARTG